MSHTDDVESSAAPLIEHLKELRNRILRLIEGLPQDHPARREGEMEIARLRWAQDKEIATMQATGRNQAPNARWIRAA